MFSYLWHVYRVMTFRHAGEGMPVSLGPWLPLVVTTYALICVRYYVVQGAGYSGLGLYDVLIMNSMAFMFLICLALFVHQTKMPFIKVRGIAKWRATKEASVHTLYKVSAGVFASSIGYDLLYITLTGSGLISTGNNTLIVVVAFLEMAASNAYAYKSGERDAHNPNYYE